MSKQAFKRARRQVKLEVNRKPLDAFAWPGGYPLYYITEDCSVLCPSCVNKEIDLIDQARHDKWDKQWRLVRVDVHWEGEPLICDHCNGQIESAYGVPE